MRLIFSAVVGLVWATCAVAPSNVYAQDYRPGYIIRNNMDSVSGYVEYATEKKNTSYCMFRSSRKGESVKLTPEELSAYGFIDDKRYTSTVWPDSTVKEKVFVKVLTNGPLKLYQYRQSFLVRKDNLMLLPVPKKQMVRNDGGSLSSVVDVRYKGLLNILVADCKLATGETKYTENDLTKLAVDYNKCKGFEEVAKKRKPMFKLNYSAFGGYSKTKLNVYDYPVSLEPSSTVTSGLGLDISSPRVFDRIFFTINASYLKNIFQVYNKTTQDDDIIHQEAVMNFTSIKIPFGIRYNFLRNENTPYIKIGFTTSTLIDHDIKTSEVVETADGLVFVKNYSTEGFAIKTNPKGFWAAVGYNRKIFNVQWYLEAWSESGSGFMGTTTHRYSDMNSFSLLFGIRF